MDRPEERITFKLTGSEAQHGLAWDKLASFVDDIRRALREHDRQRRGAHPGRGGHPTGREELVTAFRLVGFQTGSAIMELEPIAAQRNVEGELLPQTTVEELAVENLRSFLDSIEDASAEVSPAVSDALEGARSQLGDDGRIEIIVGEARRPVRRTVIDAERVAVIARRAAETPQVRTVAGRLHMLDVEPSRLAIRAGDGVDWVCSYPEDMEDEVAALVRKRVWARGVGVLSSPKRGKLELEEIRSAEHSTPTPLFTFEPLALEELAAEQGIRGPQGRIPMLPDDLSDEDVDAFVDVLLDH